MHDARSRYFLDVKPVNVGLVDHDLNQDRLKTVVVEIFIRTELEVPDLSYAYFCAYASILKGCGPRFRRSGGHTVFR